MASRTTLVRSARSRKKTIQGKDASPRTLGLRPNRFVLCIDNGGNDVDLEVGKVYAALRTEKSARDQRLIRVIDESGEDYLFSAEQFVPVKLPGIAQDVVLRGRSDT